MTVRAVQGTPPAISDHMEPVKPVESMQFGSMSSVESAGGVVGSC